MIGARATFCAAHKLPQHNEVHGHSYEVWAYTRTDWDIDAERWQQRLQRACQQLDHTTLSPMLSKMEQIAEWIAKETGAKRVSVIRPVEGLSAEFIVTQ